MRRLERLITGLLLVSAATARAGTFARTPIAPELGIDGLNRAVTRQLVGRDVFANPWATVTVSHVDVYDRFPYVESRNFQIVSDPRWNRLVCGEAGHSLAAFDGSGTATGALSSPRGLSVDDQDRVYVADTGNDRVLVLQANTNLDEITLTPLYQIRGLHAPYDVAVSDGGTPFVNGDDVLYVADTGRNRVVAYRLGDRSASEWSSIGDLGSGDGAFAGPLAIVAGRADGVNTSDVYVADAHNRRIVHLRATGGGLRWAGATPAGADVVTSLATDRWGNVYAAAPQQGCVRKFDPTLSPVAELRDEMSRPRGLHVPFSTVRDHRDGSVRRVGQPDAVTVDAWSDDGGLRRWTLGVAIDGLGVVGGDDAVAHFTLTDAADVSLDVADVGGRVLTHRAAGRLAAGSHDLPLTAADLRGLDGTHDVTLRVTAASAYGSGAPVVASAAFRATGGAVALPARPMVLGNWPNPVRGSTQISFALPANAGRSSLAVYDAAGRRVHLFAGPFAPGLNSVVWDGMDDAGRTAGAGLYFYRLEVGGLDFNGRMVVAR